MISARRYIGPAVVVWLAVSLLLTLGQFRYPEGLANDLPYLAVAAGVSLVGWLAAARLRGSDRLVGMLFAVGITATSLGDFASIVRGWLTGAEPQISVADAGWLASYAGLGAALVLLLRRGDGAPRRDVDGLIDAGAVFAAAMVAIWELAVAATLTDASLPMGVRVVWALYPVLDMALLALVVRVIIRDRSLPSLLIAGGVGLWLAADVAYLLIADAESYSVLLDAGWLWGSVLIVLAVLRGFGPRHRPAAERGGAAIDRVGLGRITLALLPLLVPSLIELYGFVRGRDTNPAVTIIGTAVLMVLAFVRMARLAWSARRARAALASQERYASALAAHSSDAVVVVGADLRLRDDYPRLAALVGAGRGGARGANLLALVVPEDLEGARAAVERCLAHPGQVFDVELRLSHSTGRRVWVAARVVNLLANPDVRGVVVNLHDISDRKHAEEQLAHQAFHDALTGLANRALFRDRLDHALDHGARTDTGLAVIFLDLDGFKTVNDSLGHDLGDDLLREVSVRLAAAVRRGDTVGRLGGDEFAILIEQSSRPRDDAVATAERVLRTLRQPVRLGDERIAVTASLGIAVGDGIRDSGRLLRNADVAMYHSKATGKDKWTVYRPGMRTAALERIELESGMQAALDRHQLRLDYQPIVDLATGGIVGFEALLRWQHPTYGLLTPDRFVPLAEETGMIVPIGRWILGEATTVAARWHEASGLDGRFTIAVNLSTRQLATAELIDDVTHALTSAGLDPTCLVVEVTETVLVHDPAVAATRLHDLHRLGVRLAIDDFGTGYSSLSYLRQFPVDILKIDRTFTSTITERGEFPAILRGILDLCRALKLKTVAEGVEHEFQRDRLRDERCDLAQGFLFARPMPATAAERLLARRDRPAPAVAARASGLTTDGSSAR